MITYLDTSFLVSLYSPDANSAAAAQVMQSSVGNHIVTTFAELEFLNALQLRVFRKELSSAEARAIAKTFEEDLCSRLLQLIALPEETFERARQLSQQTTARLGTRTGDIIHVAAALELQADVLYSFDQQQRKLAQSVHLKIN